LYHSAIAELIVGHRIGNPRQNFRLSVAEMERVQVSRRGDIDDTPSARVASLPCSTPAASSSDVESGRRRRVRGRPLSGGMRHRKHATAKPGLCAMGKVQFDIRYTRTDRSRRSDHFQVHNRWGPGRDRAMLRRSRPDGAASVRARGPSSAGRPVIDQRGRLLRAALGFAGCSMPSYDRALDALRAWLDSWAGIGHVAVGMHRQGDDLQLTQYDDRGWRAAETS
jgi:hypothetical protein